MITTLVSDPFRREIGALACILALGLTSACEDRGGHQVSATSSQPPVVAEKPLIECLHAVAPASVIDAELFQAAEIGNLTRAEHSIATGANINARDALGRTPLFIAVLCAQSETATLLINRGADIDAQDFMGMSSLHAAAADGWAPLAQLLISRGADVNSRSGDGRTPLHLAAATGCSAIVTLLLKNGGNREALDNKGLTAAALASRNGHMTIGTQIDQWLDGATPTRQRAMR